ncbi:hypothetical protein ACFLYB_03585 [Chloroflexota bacterium]
MSSHFRSNDYQPALVPFLSRPGFIDEIDSMSGEMWDSWDPFESFDGMLPEADIYEDKGDLDLEMESLGISKADLAINPEEDCQTSGFQGRVVTEGSRA